MGWAKDFSSNFVLKIAGILYVFQDFYKQKLEKKIRPERKKEFLEVPFKSIAGAKDPDSKTRCWQKRRSRLDLGVGFLCGNRWPLPYPLPTAPAKGCAAESAATTTGCENKLPEGLSTHWQEAPEEGLFFLRPKEGRRGFRSKGSS